LKERERERRRERERERERKRERERDCLFELMNLSFMLKLLLGTTLTTRSLVYSSSPLSTRSTTKRIVVIGGGAAGYFSAIECARQISENKIVGKGSNTRYEVVVLEAGQKPLTKVLISGK
jgi:hypothetical protein